MEGGEVGEGGGGGEGGGCGNRSSSQTQNWKLVWGLGVPPSPLSEVPDSSLVFLSLVSSSFSGEEREEGEEGVEFGGIVTPLLLSSKPRRIGGILKSSVSPSQRRRGLTILPQTRNQQILTHTLQEESHGDGRRSRQRMHRKERGQQSWSQVLSSDVRFNQNDNTSRERLLESINEPCSFGQCRNGAHQRFVTVFASCT